MLKINKIYCFITFVLFSFLFFSCASFFDASTNEWSIYQFKNEWNDPLHVYCARFNGYCRAFYSHTFASDEKTFIKNIRFSKYEGLYFETHSDVWFANLDNVTLILKSLNNNKESSYNSKFTNMGSYGIITVPYSDSLANDLSQDNVSIRFFTSFNYRCLFNFPTRFNSIYSQLIKNYP